MKSAYRSNHFSKYLETDRSFYRKLVSIALPVAVQSVITTGVNLIDTIMDYLPNLLKGFKDGFLGMNRDES